MHGFSWKTMSDMSWKLMFFLIVSCVACEAFETGNEIEARGKKDKLAVYVYFADLVVKKLFILKLVYAVVFWLVLHKAGYFLAWFVSYLNQQKKHHGHHAPHYSHGPYRRTSGPYNKDRHGIK